MTRPAGKSAGGTCAMGLARFLPLVLVELAEVAPSSMTMEFSVTTAGLAQADGEGPVGAASDGAVVHSSPWIADRLGRGGRPGHRRSKGARRHGWESWATTPSSTQDNCIKLS